MELIDPSKIIEDFEYVKDQDIYNTDIYDRTEIASFFDDESSNEFPIENNHGETACSEYIEFVAKQMFPMDGSWIGYKLSEETPDKIMKRDKMLNILKYHLATSNFYNERTKLIKSGTLYRKGYMDIGWDKGMNFQTLDGMDIYCSAHSEPALQRAYSEKWLSREEVIQRFEGDELKTDMSQMSVEQCNEQVRMVIAIVPINEVFFTKRSRKHSHKKVYILCDTVGPQIEVKRRDGNEKAVNYRSFPIMTYSPHHKKSLAKVALPSAIKCSYYEQLIGERAGIVNSPPMRISDSILANGRIDLGQRGITQVPDNAQQIDLMPIETKLQFNLTDQDIQRHEQKIDRIFKIPLIQRLSITNVSQFESAANRLAALDAIEPACGDLISRIPAILLKRAHDLLKTHNSEYKALAAEVEGEFEMLGFTSERDKMKDAVGIGRLFQGGSVALQAYPEDKFRISGDKTLSVLADSWDVAKILSSDEEVESAQQALQQQQDQQASQEQQMADAQVNKLNREGGQNVG